jgi:hypothetical protein
MEGDTVRGLSAHSFRVGLTQDLFAAGEDGAGIALALRWSSPTTALRYARELAVGNNAAARVLGRLRDGGEADGLRSPPANQDSAIALCPGGPHRIAGASLAAASRHAPAPKLRRT